MHHLLLCPAGNCHRHIRRGLIQTPYGLLDPSPTSPERILDRNSGCGPSQFTANLRLAKTIGIGPLDEGARTQSAPMRTAGQSQSDALNDRGLRNLIGEGFCKHARNRRLELQPRRGKIGLGQRQRCGGIRRRADGRCDEGDAGEAEGEETGESEHGSGVESQRHQGRRDELGDGMVWRTPLKCSGSTTKASGQIQRIRRLEECPCATVSRPHRTPAR